MRQTDPLDAIPAAPGCSASEAEADRARIGARNDLVTRNLGLVHHWAGRLSGRGVARDDLVQVGTLGLLRAAELFEEARGPFPADATIWIKSLMGDALDVTRRASAAEEPDDVVDPRAVDPVEALARAELGAKVRDAVGRLAARWRGAVEMGPDLEGDGVRTLVHAVPSSSVALDAVTWARSSERLVRIRAVTGEGMASQGCDLSF